MAGRYSYLTGLPTSPTAKERVDQAARHGLYLTWMPKLMQHLTEERAQHVYRLAIWYQRGANIHLKEMSTVGNLRNIPTEQIPRRPLTKQLRFGGYLRQALPIANVGGEASGNELHKSEDSDVPLIRTQPLRGKVKELVLMISRLTSSMQPRRCKRSEN